MTTAEGFSAGWLALREPADHRARNEAVRDAAMRLFAGRNEVRLIDLGCGAGSNLRALAPHLPPVQHWRLVDHDPALLQAARRELAAWADEWEPAPDGGIALRKGHATIGVTFTEADLSGGPDGVLDTGPPPDLLTAAAFFDLVASPWIARLCAALAVRRLPLYAVLTYDGTETWHPPHDADPAMRAAFHAHQATDKGFGTAAGPAAVAALALGFHQHGWRVVTGPSPWRLGPADAGLIAVLAEGSARAVGETGLVPSAGVADWLASRRIARACEIGHADFLAVPAA